MLFWPFLGGFCWVIGDLFQQYAAKYIGIGRGIPLSNTNQLWGLAWGALVFGEFAGFSTRRRLLILAGSRIMIAGAVSISMAEPARLGDWKTGMQPCTASATAMGWTPKSVAAVVAGDDPLADHKPLRHWWEVVIMVAAVGIFVWLAHRHAPSAHLRQRSLDAGPGVGTDHSARAVRQAAMAAHAIFVDEGRRCRRRG